MEQRKEREKNRNMNLKKSNDKNDNRYLRKDYSELDVRNFKAQNQTEASSGKQQRHRRQDADGEKQSKSTWELVPDMLNWAADKEKEPIYAILGDYGMGKTFSCRVFAQRLEEARQEDTSLPTPLYMDLREVDTFVEEIKDNILTKRLPRFWNEMIAKWCCEST